MIVMCSDCGAKTFKKGKGSSKVYCTDCHGSYCLKCKTDKEWCACEGNQPMGDPFMYHGVSRQSFH